MDLAQYENKLTFEPYDKEKHGGHWDMEVGLILKLKKGVYESDFYLVGNVNSQLGECDCCCIDMVDIEGVSHIKQLMKEE
jgi:hypothetical protein